MPTSAGMSTAIELVLWLNEEKSFCCRISFNQVCDHSETGVFLRRLKLIFNVCRVLNTIIKTFMLLCPHRGTRITEIHRNRQLYLTVAIFVLALQFRNNHEDSSTR